MCCCRTPTPVVPTTPASFSRYCFVDVDSFPSPFSGELFGSSFVSLDPVPIPAPPSSASATLTPYQPTAAAAPSTVVNLGCHSDSRLLTLATAGLSPQPTTTDAMAQISATSNTDNEVSSSCINGVVMYDHQSPQHDEPDIARCAPALQRSTKSKLFLYLYQDANLLLVSNDLVDFKKAACTGGIETTVRL